jgi:uroporphyrin-3 C-methyltransferase
MSNDSNVHSALTSPPTPRWRVLLAGLRRPLTLIAVAILILGTWQWLETRSRIDELQAELARRLGEGEAQSKETRALAREHQDMLQALTAKVGAVEAKQAEMVGQQMALDAMYQELSRSRDERLQADIEQAVSLAAQQLAVAGNVQAALIALQGADARLARAGQPLLLPVRKLINRDIERLKGLPLADVPGISLKLDGIVAAIETMPLAHEQRPKAEAAAAASQSPAEFGFWQGLLADLWNESKQLIRIERMDRPAPALLAPSQAFFLRENVKLRLVNARLSLLQRDGRGFRQDINQARSWFDTYFDGRNRGVQDAAATLKDLAAIEVSQELPTLGETLAALRNVKLSRDKGAAK